MLFKYKALPLECIKTNYKQFRKHGDNNISLSKDADSILRYLSDKIISDVIEADNENQALLDIINNGFYPIELKSTTYKEARLEYRLARLKNMRHGLNNVQRKK